MAGVRNLGIGAKLSILISAVAAVAVAALVLVIAIRVNAIAREDAVALARATARDSGAKVAGLLDSALKNAESLSKVFEAASVVANAGISRRQANSILQYYIERSPEAFGVYVCFEPNAYDGKDANFPDEWGHDSTGRFVPYWTRDEKGAGRIEPLADYGKAGPGDYYQVPKKTGEPAVINPIASDIGGKKVLMTSLVAPIFKEKAFIGIAGINLTLDALQKVVGETVLYKTGMITVCSANGVVVGSRHGEDVGKKIGETGKDKTVGEKVATLESFAVQGRLSSGQPGLLIGEPFAIGDTGTSWMTVAEIPTAEILGPVTALIILIVIVGLVAVALIVLAVLLVSRSIVFPIRRALQVADTLASGDLTPVIVVKSLDETGRLLAAMKNMLDKLREVVEQVGTAADAVATGSGQLSQNAETLSQGATEQAAAGEEVSSSMEEMVSSIKQNADNASQSEKMASRVSQDASDGGKMVLETVGAMKEIATKISIIEEIARQTNLLALNAAIEAARAGEQGKGFAVVASEVRKLAERSQKAAAEINAYTASSVEKAEKAGEKLLKLVPDIQKTAELVQEISAASAEQNSGADQISRAITQLDSVIQQNAANSEELASTAEELNAQASLLQSSMAFFTVERDGRRESVRRSEPPRAGHRPPVKQHALPERPHAPATGVAVQETGITVAPQPPRPAAARGGAGDGTDDDFEQF